VENPEPPEPEFVFSFKVFGERDSVSKSAPRDEAGVPVHMRGAPLGKPTRVPVRVRLTIDDTSTERTYTAKGISRDGPAIDAWRQPLSPGLHTVKIEVFTGPTTEPRSWKGQIDALPRRLHVVTYDEGEGFRVE
jgi:hypothetical protein